MKHPLPLPDIITSTSPGSSPSTSRTQSFSNIPQSPVQDLSRARLRGRCLQRCSQQTFRQQSDNDDVRNSPDRSSAALQWEPSSAEASPSSLASSPSSFDSSSSSSSSDFSPIFDIHTIRCHRHSCETTPMSSTQSVCASRNCNNSNRPKDLAARLSSDRTPNFRTRTCASPHPLRRNVNCVRKLSYTGLTPDITRVSDNHTPKNFHDSLSSQSNPHRRTGEALRLIADKFYYENKVRKFIMVHLNFVFNLAH